LFKKLEQKSEINDSYTESRQLSNVWGRKPVSS